LTMVVAPALPRYSRNLVGAVLRLREYFPPPAVDNQCSEIADVSDSVGSSVRAALRSRGMFPGNHMIRHLIHHVHSIERLMVEVGERPVSAGSGNGNRQSDGVGGPQCHVEQVNAPICEEPTAIIPEHAPGAVESGSVE